MTRKRCQSTLCPHPEGALHGIAAAHREWSAAQKDMSEKLFGKMAQCLRDHDVAPSGPEDWMEDDELIEAEMVVMLTAGG